jgi:hypothetical protein
MVKTIAVFPIPEEQTAINAGDLWAKMDIVILDMTNIWVDMKSDIQFVRSV